MAAALIAIGAAALACWVGVLVHPARPWDLRPRDDGDEPPPPPVWPPVCALVPARNEAEVLPSTLPALLAQDYPGELRVVLVDDRSTDGTAAVAGADARVTVVPGAPLPEGWVGKVWALEQGLPHTEGAAYLLLTDADILHAPDSVRRLVAESESLGLALDSRMARLHAEGLVERLLVPPFVYFFALLYPLRWANDPRRRLAAAAGGCVLLRRSALLESGGFAAIRGAVIDDVSLARQVKRLGAPVRLEVSAGRVRSLRRYRTLGGFWRTVRRTAFTQLRHSWLLLAVTVALLALLFVAPVALAVAGLTGTIGVAAPVLGAAAWLAAAAAYLPTVRLYGLAAPWALSLPLAGLLYGGMTVDSAVGSRRRGRGVW